jgi:quercetin dioxygenase-like cupin family protein
VTPWQADPPTTEEVRDRFGAEGLAPSSWSNGPGARYEWHRHAHHKVLYCLEGSIVFHTRQYGDFHLRPGDRLDLPAGTDHAATVGDRGVTCMEAGA